MEKTVIKPKMLFIDSAGCPLKTLRRVPGSTDWWCTGQSNHIGKWRYSESNILKGVERWQSELSDHTFK
jgi:hypothetical protein